MPGKWERPGRSNRPSHFAAAISRSVTEFGGLVQLTRRAVGLVRREGLPGLLRGAMAFRATTRRQKADGRNDYARWIVRYDRITSQDRAEIADRIRTFNSRPLISVLMPVYNPAPCWLQEAIESVRAQLYPDWELCIADDASTDPAVRTMLMRYAQSDARIKVAFRDRNGHISASSNTALSLARGEWVALFDHDDLLAGHALYYIAEAINAHPDAGLIYSDEDKITESGVRCVPHFKPDWNYELLLSYNFICHLGVYRRSLVEEAGGFREGLEGAQDYDLALRCVEKLAPRQILHIPRVLYHWRMHASSTAIGGQSKPYALPAGERALNDHFVRTGTAARAELRLEGFYLPRFAMDSRVGKVSVIVPVRANEKAQTFAVSKLKQRTRYTNVEFILAVQAQGASAAAVHAHDPGAALTVQAEPGESEEALIDRAAELASGDFLAVVTAGQMPERDIWLEELLALAARPGVGVVGPRQVGPRGEVTAGFLLFGIGDAAAIAHRGLPKGDNGYFHRAVLVQAVSAISGQCVVGRKSVYRQVGGLCRSGMTGIAAYADLCARLREVGLRCIYAGHVSFCMEHKAAGMAPPALTDMTSEITRQLAAAGPVVRERWAPLLESDPAYNPNLTRDVEDFSLAWPPRVRPASCREEAGTNATADETPHRTTGEACRKTP